MLNALVHFTKRIGLKSSNKMTDEHGVSYECGQGSTIYLYQRGPSKADHTLLNFIVNDAEAMVDELAEKGVTFEQYDLPDLKTDSKGIATIEQMKSAWFKDPDGNILAILELG